MEKSNKNLSRGLISSAFLILILTFFLFCFGLTDGESRLAGPTLFFGLLVAATTAIVSSVMHFSRYYESVQNPKKRLAGFLGSIILKTFTGKIALVLITVLLVYELFNWYTRS